MPQDPGRLARAELPSDTVALAKFLIGKGLIHDLPEGRVGGRIVETEAYVVGDAAGHAFRGMTRRNRALFLERGHAYVYLGYGIWNLVNVSSEDPGIGAGVLLRALEPMIGVELMRSRGGGAPLSDLARGPGLLARATGIDLGHDGVDLCADGPLWLGRWDRPAGEIVASARIGITREVDRLLRFHERDSPFVSGPKRSRA